MRHTPYSDAEIYTMADEPIQNTYSFIKLFLFFPRY